MKLFKPTYSYGAKQSSFSKYEHHEQMSQSNYALDAKPCYGAPAQDYFLGHSMGDFDANDSHHARGQNSIDYHAQAQSALPSLPLHVQQDHQVGKMKRHDNHVGNDWAGNSPKYAYPADDSMLGMHNEKHMMGEMEHGWGTKPNQYSSPTQTHQFGGSDYKGYGQKPYNHVDNGIEGGWDNNPNRYSSPTQTHRFGETGYKGPEQNAYNYGEGQIEGGYANKNNAFSSPKYLSPIKTNQPSIVKHKEGHGWPNSTSNYSSPTHAQHSNLGMHKDSHMMGKVDQGWANSPNKFPSSNPTHQSAHLMPNNNEHMMQKRDHHGWSHSPNKFSNSPQTHHTSLGGIDHGWDNSPSKVYNPTQAHHSSRGMQTEEHMGGNMNHGWANSPTKYSGPNNVNNSNEREGAQLGWSQNSSKGFGPNQANRSGYAAYHNEYDQHVDDDVHDIMDEILTKYPAHNVSSGPEKSWAAKPNSYAGQNKFASHAKQAIGGLAHYGGAIQSMNKSSAKFALTKENNNAGYNSNFGKEEHSATSNSKKYEAKFTLDRGRY